MQADRPHPVSYALTVARACAEFALEAMNQRSFPKPYASALSVAAEDAATRLGEFLSAQGETIAPDALKTASLARTDLEAVAQITMLIIANDLAPKAASFVARSVRYTAEHAVNRLSHVEEAIGA
ncbi:hypothetical protein [Dyella solisilvae]|nr:hypothetical protein [Dyella solisilvae]